MPVFPTDAEIRKLEPWADLTMEERRILCMKLTQTEVADLLQLSQSRVSELTSEGILPRGKDGKYVLHQMAHAWWSYLRGEYADLRPRRRYSYD
jgi:hypothetical protein